jgi:hypothetical protein
MSSAPTGAPALRPLSVGEILDAGINIYRRNARTLIVLSAIVVVPFQILSAVVTLSTVSTSSEVPRGLSAFGNVGRADHAASAGGDVIVSIIGLVVGLLVTAACVKAVSDAYMDREADAGVSLRFAGRRIGSLLWLELLLIVLLGLAFVAFIIPGIWLYAAWSVATPALMIEGVRGRRALGRSYGLVRGRWWPTAGVVLVTNLILSIVGGVIAAVLAGIVLSGATHSVLSTVFLASLAQAVASVVTQPFQAAVITVLYYDLRVRHEGYDVELLAEQLGIAPAGIAPAPGSGSPQALPGAPAGRPPGIGPESVGKPGGPPFWPPPPGWRPPPPGAGSGV